MAVTKQRARISATSERHFVLPDRYYPADRHPQPARRWIYWLVAAVVLATVAAAWVLGDLTARQTSLHRTPTDVTYSPVNAPEPTAVAVPASVLEAINEEVLALGWLQPQAYDAIQAAYRESGDLYGLLMDLIPSAKAGNGAAQYHIYLALEECRAYLGPNGDATLQETTLQPFWRKADSGDGSVMESDLERELWLNEYHRCKHFVDASLVSLETAMGEATPGDVAEYGAVWFEQAFHSDYPLARADMALRLSTLSAEERIALLESSISSGDPLVYLALSEQSRDQQGASAGGVHAAAWLLLACRAGLDCGPQAYWFRSRVCASHAVTTCRPGETAISHFWTTLTARQQHTAYFLAESIHEAVEEGKLREMPWPSR